MNLFAVMLLSAFVFNVSYAEKSEEIKIKTSAYSWMCKNKIETKVNKMDGVNDCELDLSNKTLTIKFDSSKISEKDIINQIEDLGYDAELKPNTEKMVEKDKKKNEE